MSKNRNPIVERIDRALLAAGMTRNAAEDKAGLGQGFIRAIERRGPDASAGYDNLVALAGAIGCKIEDILPGAAPVMQITAPMPDVRREIPIMGVANGSAIGAFVLSQDPIGYVQRPPGLASVVDAYALYVRNDSMFPRYPAGELVFVHPHKPARAGDGVIIQVRDKEEYHAYIKTLTRRTAEWDIVAQLNPPAEIKFAPSSVVAIHKVMTTAELFGA